MEKKLTLDWQRLETVIRSAGMSVNRFALYIGLKRSENLYQIKKGNHGISKQLAITINEHFPKFSISWLMTGENPPGEGIPRYGEEIKVIPIYLQIPTPGNMSTKSSADHVNRSGQEDLAKVSTGVSLLNYTVFDAAPVNHYAYLGESLTNGAEFGIINTDESLGPRIPVGALMLVQHPTGPIVFGKL